MNEKIYYNENEYPNFKEENSKTGTLKIQAYTANQAFPLEGVDITVSKQIDGKRVILYEGQTDSSGIIDDIVLPAKPAKDNIESVDDIVYTTYDITADYKKTNEIKQYEVSIFDDLKIIQPIKFSTIEGPDSDGN